jgi:hypothetical protein
MRRNKKNLQKSLFSFLACCLMFTYQKCVLNSCLFSSWPFFAEKIAKNTENIERKKFCFILSVAFPHENPYDK